MFRGTLEPASSEDNRGAKEKVHSESLTLGRTIAFPLGPITVTAPRVEISQTDCVEVWQIAESFGHHVHIVAAVDEAEVVDILPIHVVRVSWIVCMYTG